MGPLHLSLTRTPGILLYAAARGDSGRYGAHSGAAGPPRGLRLAGTPTAPALSGGSPLRPSLGAPAARDAPALTRPGRLPAPVRVSTRVPDSIRGTGRGLRSPPARLRSVQQGPNRAPRPFGRPPPQHQHRLPRGRLVMFG
ncbi:hypothetical protein NDU88_007522 [Pleurodeles waltl]|uniref:Uncharacterized protein n=1 Tax=Pleurodeles waltl TaxID=8319 RepID=A0AAV7QP31_PLEWA|nr:hypothetical protein NDU88_007522 [Pleurodeles waltl]